MSHRNRLSLALLFALFIGTTLFPGHARATDAWASREEPKTPVRSLSEPIQLGLPGGNLPSEVKPSWYLSPELAPKKMGRAPASIGDILPRELVNNVGQQAEPDPAYQPVSDSFKRRMGY